MRTQERSILLSLMICTSLVGKQCLAAEYQVPGAFQEVADLINNTNLNPGDVVTVSNRSPEDPNIAYRYFEIPSGVLVQSAPSQSPIVEAKDPSGQPTNFAVSFPPGAAANTILMGFTVRGGGLQNCLIDLRGAGRIIDCYVEGDGYTAILAEGATGAIEQTTVSGGDPSIQVSGGSDLVITGSAVNNGRMWIDASDVHLTETNLTAPQIAMEVDDSHVTIVGGSMAGPRAMAVVNSDLNMDGCSISASYRGIESEYSESGHSLSMQGCDLTGAPGSETGLFLTDLGYRLPGINIATTNVTGWDAGIVATGCSLSISGCGVETDTNGICVLNPDAISITGCHVTNQSGIGIWLTYDPSPIFPYLRDEVEVSDCVLTSIPSESSAGILFDGTGTRYPSIISNSIIGWGVGLWIHEVDLISGTELRNNLVALAETAGIIFATPHELFSSGITCNDSWGNSGCFSEDPGACNNFVDTYGLGYGASNISSNPLLCGDPFALGEDVDVRIDSPCSAENNTCGQIGAGLTACAYGILERNTTVGAHEIHVLDDVLVPVGLDLTIQPGATMKVGDDTGLSEISGGNDPTRAELIVDGTLNVAGASGNAVYFLSDKTNPGSAEWYGIEVQSNATATLSYLDVAYAEIGVSATGSATVDLPNGVRVHDCSTGLSACDEAVMSMPSSGVIEGCDIGVWSEGAAILDLGQTYQTNQVPWVVKVRDCTTLGIGMSSTVTGFLEQVSVEGVDADAWTGIHVFPGAQANIVRCEVRDANGAFPIGIFVEGETTLRGVKVSHISPPGPNQYGVGLGLASPPSVSVSLDRASHLGPMWRNPQVVGCHSGIQVMGDSEPVIRNSEIADNSVGVEISPAAIPDLGLGEAGNNSITGSSRLAWGPSRIAGVSNVPASGNWWDSDPPDPLRISSWVDYYGYLHSQPSYAEYAATGMSPVLAEPDGPLKIRSAFPMPFSRDVDISVSIPAGDRASVFVFNVSGEKIRTLGANEPPGERVFHWDGKLEDGRRAVGGVYFLKVVTDRESVAKTLVLVK